MNSEERNVIQNLLKALEMANISCSAIHHEKKHQHGDYEECPASNFAKDARENAMLLLVKK